METSKLNTNKKQYYFIGIGGIGMSGLAKILIMRGETVSGSDLVENKQTKELERLGAKINHEQVTENINNLFDFVIVSSAIDGANPEMIRAKELGLTIVTRSKLLNDIISSQKAIAVTGTHGKTTTSSMIASVMTEAGLDPTAIIGSEVKTIEGNARNGKGEYSIAEVCEYKRAFLDVYPFAAVITNIEADHLDCYQDINDIISAFSKFVTQIDKKGFLVVNGEDKNAIQAIGKYDGEIIKCGFSSRNDVYADKIVQQDGQTTFIATYKGKPLGRFVLSIPGKHNIFDALLTITVCYKLGIETENIIKSLKDFTGAERRFQRKGELASGALIYDDYGHHPTELKATLKGAKEFFPKRRIVAVFQPHQYSRTKFLMSEFADAFGDADEIVIVEIYAARDTEEDKRTVSSKQLVEKIVAKGKRAKYLKDYKEAEKYLTRNLRSNDLIITLGAGPVYRVGESLLNNKSVEKCS